MGLDGIRRFAATARSVSVPCSLSPPFPCLWYKVPVPSRSEGVLLGERAPGLLVLVCATEVIGETVVLS